jgi:hypothetical protein
MSTYEPNPPARREEDFPKTTTIPEGWMTDTLMEVYNSPSGAYDPQAGEGKSNGKVNGRSNGKASDRPAPAQANTSEAQESPFARQLEPFPTTPDLTSMYL